MRSTDKGIVKGDDEEKKEYEPEAAFEYERASNIWLIWLASGHSTSMGCEESLASRARAL
jgi:hypothetical protein